MLMSATADPGSVDDDGSEKLGRTAILRQSRNLRPIQLVFICMPHQRIPTERWGQTYSHTDHT